MDWATVATTAIVAGASIGGTLGGVTITGRRDERRAEEARRAADRDNRAVLYREYLTAATLIDHVASTAVQRSAASWRSAVLGLERCTANLELVATEPVLKAVNAAKITWLDVQIAADWDDEAQLSQGGAPERYALQKLHSAYTNNYDAVYMAGAAVVDAMRADVGPASEAHRPPPQRLPLHPGDASETAT